MEDKFADTISQFGFQAEVVTPGGRRFPPLCRHLTLIGSDLDKKKLLCRHFTLIGDRNGLCSGPVFTPRPTTMWFALVSKSWSPDTQIQWHAKAALRSTQIILGLIIPGMGLTTALLILCGYAAWNPVSRRYLDRVSFRLLIHALLAQYVPLLLSNDFNPSSQPYLWRGFYFRLSHRSPRLAVRPLVFLH
jgi:hypothetical protein